MISIHSVRRCGIIACSLFMYLVALPLYGVAAPLTYEEEVLETTHPEWTVSLGGGAMTRPEFEGSDKYVVRFLPILHAEYKGRVFLSSADGLGIYAFRGPLWNLGAVVKYNPGRKENSSRLLSGMRDIDPGAEIGAFATWTPAPFFVRLEALAGTGDVEGLQATASVGHSMILLSRMQWTNSLGATYTDDTYNNTFFGVDSGQSLRSGYQRYDADAGIKSVQFGSRLSYQITTEISATAFGEYKRLTGPAADSPLVKAGSENQGMFGLGLVYTFRP